jgi:DNA-binding CsgD family transcriptional regulator
MTDGQFSKRGAVADWWARLVQAMAGIVARDPSRPNPFWSGDLLEGIVAVAALLLMLAIGIPEWLAIPFAVATYVGLTLLRPPRELHDESVVNRDEEEDSGETPVSAVGPSQPADASARVYQLVAQRYGLTRRETEIVPMLERRLGDKEIAERLSISDRTAGNHVTSVLGKFGLKSRRDVADFIERHRRLPPSPPNAGE